MSSNQIGGFYNHHASAPCSACYWASQKDDIVDYRVLGFCHIVDVVPNGESNECKKIDVAHL